MTQKYLNLTTQSVAWFQKRSQEGELELKAPFQRNPVWTDKQKSYLIDSILNGYPIPELYMQQYTDAMGADKHLVVDGQQRLRACLEFLSGSFQLDATDSPKWADMRFDDLGEEDKKELYNYKFVIRVLPEMPDEELRAMFQRLNRNVVALNRQELRHATYWGGFITCVEHLANDERWSSFAIFTPNDVRRMLDIEFISELAVGFLHGLQNKKDRLDDFYEIYEPDFGEKSRLESVFNAILGEILAILPDIELTRWRKKSDFYSLFLCFGDRANSLPFARDQRAALSDAFRSFANDVDSFLRDPIQYSNVSDSVKNYAANVERAASDLANRRARRDEINSVMKSCEV